MNQIAKTVTSKTLILTMSLIVVSAAVAAPWPGSGTEGNPYQIADADDLRALASDPNFYVDSFIVTADIDLAGRDGMDFIIGKDTDSSNEDFDGTFFTGSFDGNYHVIQNMTIDARGTDNDFLGLFGWIDTGFEENGKVSNLGIENSVIIVGDTDEDSSYYVGVLAGASSAPIENCYTTGTISDANSENLGGLLGINSATIQNCYSDVDITGGVNSQTVGGFVGFNYGAIINCYASGAVSGGGDVGGFAGFDFYFVESAIEDCYFLRLADGGGPDNGIASELTDGQMQQQSSFSNWDFFGEATNGIDEIWQMSGYPVLGWQVPVEMPELLLLAQYWLTQGCSTGQPCSVVDWYTDGTVNLIDFGMLNKSWRQPVVAVNRLEIGDDFETGDFDYMPWVMGGDADWVIVSDVVYEGSYAAKSGNIGDSQTTAMEFTVDLTGTGYDYIGFYMKTSTQADADKLMFYDNDFRPGGNFYGSGELDWTYFSFPVDSGITHTFKWAYEKDGSGSSGSDCIWIDKIEVLDLY